MQLGYKHRNPQLIFAEDPIKSLDDCRAGLRDSVLLCPLEESRSHAVLMDRIDFVEVDNSSACYIKEPRPLALWTLQCNHVPSAFIRDFNCPLVVRQLPISVAGQLKIRLSCERGVPSARAEGRIEKQPRVRTIPVDEKREQFSCDGRPFGAIELGLGCHPDDDHADILSSKRAPLILIRKQ